MKNNVIIKTTLIISILAVSFAMIWFILGSTACFQRNMDVVENVTLISVWLPALALVVLAVFILKKGWLPITVTAKTGLIIAITVASLFFAITLIRTTTLHGWIKEKVDEDYIQITEDEKYEYRLELVNMFQRNSYARIYIKNIADGKEVKIPLDIPTKEKYVLSGGKDYMTNPDPDNLPVWTKMMPTDEDGVYILTTTGIFDREDTYCFTIDLVKSQMGT